MKKALIVHGGWQGHEPKLVSARLAKILEGHGFDVTVTEDKTAFAEYEKLKDLDLIIPLITMDEMENDYVKNISLAVADGVGMAGSHGGMCDALRQSVDWQFMTGGQWVAHPGNDGTDYMVNIMHSSSPIVAELADFPVCSEQYYLHVDPAVEVLATTRFPVAMGYHMSNKPVDMPVAWTKFWGHGRIFYTALGHLDSVFDNSPTAQVLIERGMLWAAESRERATRLNLSRAVFEPEEKKED